MRPNWKKVSRGLALFVAFALMQVYVLATPTVPDKTVSNAGAGATLFGRLSTLGQGKVIVNGNAVATGTTILSGSQLQTPEATGATILLGSAGKLDIAPKTNLTLSFDQSSIIVNVTAGDALLTANEGVRASFTTPGGKTKVSDGKNSSSIGSPIYSSDDPDSQNSQNRKCTIADIPCALFWAMVGGGAAVVIFFAATRGENPSQGAPQ